MPFKIDWLSIIIGVAVGLAIHAMLDSKKIPVNYPKAVQ